MIAVTLALRAPTIEIWASDTCARALEIASANAERLGARCTSCRATCSTDCHATSG